MFSTHDTGNGDWFFVICNYQGALGQFDFLAIQQNQLFTNSRHSDNDPALDFITVKGVHGLTKFQHHVIGDIHGGVN